MGLERRFVTGKVIIDSAHRVFVNDQWVQGTAFIGDFEGKEIDIMIELHQEKKGMTLEDAKKLFEAKHPEETQAIKNNTPYKTEAGLVWRGFKSALIETAQMEEKQ